MFGRKAKRGRMYIEGVDGKDGRMFFCALSEFPLPERVVLELSVEYFNDPEPCEIHRAAVQKRAMMELLELCDTGRMISVERLTEAQCRYFPVGTVKIYIREEKQ